MSEIKVVHKIELELSNRPGCVPGVTEIAETEFNDYYSIRLSYNSNGKYVLCYSFSYCGGEKEFEFISKEEAVKAYDVAVFFAQETLENADSIFMNG